MTASFPPSEGGTSSLDAHFSGAAFEDALYQTDDQIREAACAWKIMRSPHFFDLTDGSWLWRAVGIPLHLADPSLQGDVDLMFAVRTEMRLDERGHPFPPLYRCFELKTAKVSRDGAVRSLKGGKFHKTQGQLEKLCKFGAPQVFLLEAFIVEAGYSRHREQTMPSAVRESVAEKYDRITRAEYGYVALALEQIEGKHEESGGVVWPTITIKEARVSSLRTPFSRLVAAIEDHVSRTGGFRYNAVITYCDGCKRLTHAAPRGPYRCAACERPLF